ncbi:MAG: ASCH domain-containing protein, partial [Alphaproteobacteria bacterium]
MRTVGFKPEYVPLILAGTKTQTRRRGVKHYAVGQCLTAQNSATGEAFAVLEVTRVFPQYFAEMTDADAVKDGFPNRALFW